MLPRKKALGPRPRRGVGTAAAAAANKASKSAVLEPTLSSPINDGPAETTAIQYPIFEAVLGSSFPPNGAETRNYEGVNSGKEETLNQKDEKLENSEEEASDRGLGVNNKKKKIVKRKVVKVVKKLVKKRVPKGLAGSFGKEEKSSVRVEGEVIGSSDGLEAKEAKGGQEVLDNGVKAESLVMEPALSIDGGGSLDGLDGCDDNGGVSNVSEPVSDVKLASEWLDRGGGDGNGRAYVSPLAQEVKLEALDSGLAEDLPISKVSANNVDRMVDVSSEVGSSQIMDVCEGGNELFSREVGDEKYSSRIDSSDSTDDKAVGILDVNVGGDRNGMDMTNIVEESSGEKEIVKGDDDEMANGGIVLSGELEALERKRRRKTEIFIGGLSVNAKEDDVRRVFEEAGEVLEVRLVTNNKTGRNRGFAFVRYALAADAKKALEKHPKVEICGKQCKTAPVEGNDTIFLGNIDKKWKTEDVIKLLLETGIQKIDKVTVMTDPGNPERNRGFAFIELETCKDAQIAFKNLQKKDLLGKLKNIKVAWAEPLNEPDEEEMSKVKSVYAEYLPLSWDEEKVRNYFKKFGEIENVVLARNLQSSKRKDFAFVTFGNREAALACIESFNNGVLIDKKSEVNVKVSLAKPMPKGKLPKKVSQPASLGTSKQKLKSTQRLVEPMKCRTEAMHTVHATTNRVDTISAGSAKLEQLLADRALWRQTQERLGLGFSAPRYSHTLAGRKRPLSSLDDDMYHLEPRGYTCLHVDNSLSDRSLRHREVPPGIAHNYHSYHQQQGSNAAPGFAPDYEHIDYAKAYQREGGSQDGKGGYPYRFG